MDEFLCNNLTKTWIDAYISRPKAALLIKSTHDTAFGIQIAEYIYNALSDSRQNPLYKLELKDKKSIGIDDVRELQKHLSFQANDTDGYSRFILITEAERLTPEAQNALLKLIEELPKRTILMLVASNSENILATIISRCFHINVLPISKIQAIEYAKKNKYNLELAEKSFLISEGNASIFKELLNGTNTSLEDLIVVSKKFIQASIFDRQSILQSLYKNETNLLQLLHSLQITARSGMINSKTVEAKHQWKKILTTLIETEKQINSNVQTKLALLSLSVSI
jgi:DNA polymerase III delta prime subunit